jgi:mRNA-degrading endonuclease RelE of RelBE toxin-antitoxin system
VKRIKSLEGVLSSRIGRYRLLFRLEGDDGIAFLRLIHRRDLEVTLRRMD